MFSGGASVKTLLYSAVAALFLGAMYLAYDFIDDSIEQNKLLLIEKSQLKDRIIALEIDLEAQQLRYEKSIEQIREGEKKVSLLERQLNETTQAREQDREVFEKEKGRFDRLLQRKGSLLAHRATVATERMRLALERAGDFTETKTTDSDG